MCAETEPVCDILDINVPSHPCVVCIAPFRRVSPNQLLRLHRLRFCVHPPRLFTSTITSHFMSHVLFRKPRVPALCNRMPCSAYQQPPLSHQLNVDGRPLLARLMLSLPLQAQKAAKGTRADFPTSPCPWHVTKTGMACSAIVVSRPRKHTAMSTAMPDHLLDTCRHQQGYIYQHTRTVHVLLGN